MNKPYPELYDYILVAFSGGKDSLACILRLLDLGIPASKIECWHHCVDGKESNYHLFDWPCTESYCKAVCNALGIKLYFSWHEGGIKREMFRLDQQTAPNWFETPYGLMRSGEGIGGLGTRMRFPQASSDLKIRWCSSYAKIMVMSSAIRGQDRFEGYHTLVVSGERRQESKKRSEYLEFNRHGSDCKARRVDVWRPVIDYSEEDVWNSIKKHGIVPHPAYFLGFGRCSCATCIFGSANMWASLHKIAPQMVERMIAYEEEFADYWRKENTKKSSKMKKDYTLHRKFSIRDTIKMGVPFNMEQKWIDLALSKNFDHPVIVSPEDWILPQGAFGDASGPS